MRQRLVPALVLSPCQSQTQFTVNAAKRDIDSGPAPWMDFLSQKIQDKNARKFSQNNALSSVGILFPSHLFPTPAIQTEKLLLLSSRTKLYSKS